MIPVSLSLCCLWLDLQHIAIRLPDSLPIFELLVVVTDEIPQLCVGVRDCSNGNQTDSPQLQFDMIELNSMPIWEPGKKVTIIAV